MRDRTADLLRARQALSQLSYNPIDQAISRFVTKRLVRLNLFPSRQSHAKCASAHERGFNAEGGQIW